MSSEERIAYLVRFGCLCLVEEHELGDSAILSGARLRKFEGFEDEMVRCLNRKPNISNVMKDIDEENVAVALVRGDIEGMSPLYFGTIRCSVHLPRKNQQVSETYTGDVIEDFSIQFCGSAFVAYGLEPSSTELYVDKNLVTYDWQFAREAASVLRSAFQDSAKWKIAEVGPTPIHPLFHVKLESRADIDKVTIESQGHDSDVDVLIRLPESVDGVQFLEDLLAGAVRRVGEFYSANLLRHQAMMAIEEIIAQRRKAWNLYNELHEIPGWKVWSLKRHSLIAEVRRAVSQAYDRYVLWAELQRGVHRRADFVCRLVARNKFLHEAEPYFRERLLEDMDWETEGILRSLQFLEEESRSIGIQRATVEAALIWGIIGGMVFWGLTAIFG